MELAVHSIAFIPELLLEFVDFSLPPKIDCRGKIGKDGLIKHVRGWRTQPAPSCAVMLRARGEPSGMTARRKDWRRLCITSVLTLLTLSGPHIWGSKKTAEYLPVSKNATVWHYHRDHEKQILSFPSDLPFSDTAMGYRKNLFEIKSREYWTHKELGGGRDIIACRLWIQ